MSRTTNTKGMKMEHTPGPWRAVDRKDARGNIAGISIWAGDGEDQYGLPKSVKICSLPDGASLSGGHCFPEQVGNAHLIAAAPELLEALKGLLGTFAFYFPGEDSPTTKKARAAIGQAERTDR